MEHEEEVGTETRTPSQLVPCTRRLTTLLATPKRLEATQWYAPWLPTWAPVMEMTEPLALIFTLSGKGEG